ncbi:MAG: GNAT family N-acetyltransferase [Clostridia bacterium]|nr:GNAT family N-acetyltransferase [Clostridia bacterium]
MRFQPREIRLKDGRTCLLRPVTPEDAPEMIAFLRQVAGETDFLLRCPDEVTFTLEQEQEILGRILEDPASAMMVAVVDGNVAGNASIGGNASKRKVRHRCSLGIALKREFWRLGIGTALIQYLTELARQIGYRQMDLEVVADNERAQALYTRSGFVESGRRHNGMLFDDGTYHDEILMYKPLD